MPSTEDNRELLERLLLEKYEPIAIVGTGMRLPGGNDSREALADFLRAGRTGIGPIPADRWDVPAFASAPHEPVERGKIATAGGGFLDGVDMFDPAFFGISPKEASYVDPQQRLILETSWEALEDAGLDATALRGANGGVYVGVSAADYMVASDELPHDELDGYLGAGTAHSAVSGRLAYFLGWHGPCVSVDTACSSSLVALHLAVQDLRQRQCDVALCGAVSLILHPQAHIVTSQAGMLAPDGQCKTFDDSADGYARSEGCGVLALKRMSDAKRDGDRILALVRGTAIRQDGESGGLTVPNGRAQQRVMRAALDNSATRPEDIQYVEAHGTGTAVGDPIEVDAIAGVFARSHDRDNPVLIGSVKTNLGHSEPAAGVSGVLKVLLQLADRRVYPHLNLTTPSSRIPWDDIPVAVPTSGADWPAAPTRRALVNSFGFAGTIASAVVEQAPPAPEEPSRDSGPGVLTLSARNRKALRGQVQRYLEHLEAHPDLDVGVLCHASNVARAHLPARLAGVVADRSEAVALLAKHTGETAESRRFGKVAFLYTGQGAQRAGMGADLYRRHRAFAVAVDECDALFATHLDGRSIAELMFGTDEESLGQTRFTQPALFTLEYALTALWASWGIRPDVLIGHSIGEVVAATVAGVFTPRDAVTLVATRARLMQSVRTPGGMLAVLGSAEQVTPLLAGHDDLALAAMNAPDQCVVSGGRDALAAVAAELARHGLRGRELPVSHAFHSPLMAEVTREFRAAIADIEPHAPEIALVSNLTGEVASAAEVCDLDYWVRLIREPVDFVRGMRTVAARGPHAMLEIGPGRTLLDVGRRCVPAEEHAWIASLEGDDGGGAAEPALAAVYTAGLPVDWAGVHSDRPRPRLSLPTYAFDRRRHWLPAARKQARSGHPLLGAEVSTSDSGVREFACPVSAEQPAYLADHQVAGQVVFPAAGFVEVLVAAVDAVFGDTAAPIRDLTIHEALFLTDEQCVLRTRVTPAGNGSAALEIVSTVGDVERRHVTATAAAPGDAVVGELTELAEAMAGDGELAAIEGAPGEVADLYDDFVESEMEYGPRFRLIRSFKRQGEDLSVAELTGPGGVPTEHLPPAVLDAALQSLATVIQPGLPVRFRAFRLLSRPRGERLRSVIRLRPAGEGSDVDYVADVLVRDGNRTVCVLTGLELRHVARSPGSRRRLYHEPRWVERPARAPGPDDEPGDPRADVCWFWRAGDGSVAEECERNLTELLELVRSLEEKGFGGRLWLVTRGAQRLADDPAGDESALAATTAWGFGAVLANEYPAWRVTMVDLPPGDGDMTDVTGVRRTTPEDELQVAVRGERRYVRRIEQADPEQRPETSTVDAEHTYVVTGGFGGLGIAAARTLVGLGARHLALVGRRVPDERRLAELRAELGVEITALAADVAEPDDVHALFEALAESGSPVGGVIHAAGQLADKPVTAQTWADLDTVFRAKVYGSLLLHQATAGLPEVTFFVGYASSSTVFGQAGQANYAAGNAFLDALMHWRVANGLPGAAIDWGPWDEIGMAAGLSERRREAYVRQGMRFVRPRDGGRALATLLARPAPQTVVGECDWNTFASTRPLPNALYEQLARPAGRTAVTVDLEELAARPAAERHERLAELVRATIAGVLHFDTAEDIQQDVPFANLGLDSLAGVEVKNKLEAALGTALPTSVIFDHPETGALASYLDTVVTGSGDGSGEDGGWDLDDAEAELAALKEAS
jgi:acyl transferase domain-containing protein/acyl carrier protein